MRRASQVTYEVFTSPPRHAPRSPLLASSGGRGEYWHVGGEPVRATAGESEKERERRRVKKVHWGHMWSKIEDWKGTERDRRAQED